MPQQKLRSFMLVIIWSARLFLVTSSDSSKSEISAMRKDPRPYLNSRCLFGVCQMRACFMLAACLVCTCLCLIFTLCVLSSKTRLYQRATLICLWVISQQLFTSKIGRAELLPSYCLDQSECSSCLARPISQMAEEDGDELPSVDHGPLNQGPWEK